MKPDASEGMRSCGDSSLPSRAPNSSYSFRRRGAWFPDCPVVVPSPTEAVLQAGSDRGYPVMASRRQGSPDP
jgi:hypothetical protein